MTKQTRLIAAAAACSLLALLPLVQAGPAKVPAGGAVLAKPRVGIPGPFNPRIKLIASAADQAERQDWGLGDKGINVAGAWAVTKGKGVKVAILDTGVDDDHPDLKGQVVATKDFTSSPAGAKDVKGHGTFCAGIVAMKEDKAGYVGVAPECQLLIAKVLDDDATGEFDWVIAGIEWAIEQKADIISLSLQDLSPEAPDAYQPQFRAAIQKAVAKGIIVVAAAGNQRGSIPPPCVTYPGRFPECITVAATDSTQSIALTFSGSGPEVTVAAPGDNVTSTQPYGRYAADRGTSFATPIVAGVAALYVATVRAKRPAGTPSQDEFRQLIKDTSYNPSGIERNDDFGWGLIQADKLVAAASGKAKVASAEFSRADYTEAGWKKLQDLLPQAKSVVIETGPNGIKMVEKK